MVSHSAANIVSVSGGSEGVGIVLLLLLVTPAGSAIQSSQHSDTNKVGPGISPAAQ